MPATAATNCAVSVATPDAWHSRLSIVRSATSTARAGPAEDGDGLAALHAIAVAAQEGEPQARVDPRRHGGREPRAREDPGPARHEPRLQHGVGVDRRGAGRVGARRIAEVLGQRDRREALLLGHRRAVSRRLSISRVVPTNAASSACTGSGRGVCRGSSVSGSTTSA